MHTFKYSFGHIHVSDDQGIINQHNSTKLNMHLHCIGPLNLF